MSDVIDNQCIDEIWKAVIYEGYDHYMVSNYSRIRNSKGRILSPDKTQSVKLCSGGKILSKIVYVIAIETFKGLKPDDGVRYTVDHLDRNHHNNHIDNLVWATGSEQNLNKRERVQTYGIKLIYERDGETTLYDTITQAVKALSVSQTYLRKLLKNADSIEIAGGILSTVINAPKPEDIAIVPDWIYRDGAIPDVPIRVSKCGLVERKRIWFKGSQQYITRPECKQYYSVSIIKKMYGVHQLIIAAFLGPPPIDEKGRKYITHHDDNNGLNNALGNLEYKSLSDNSQHAVALGLYGNRPVLEYTLSGEFIREYFSINEAERHYKIVENSGIGKCCSYDPNNPNSQKSCNGSQWRYKINDDFPKQIDAILPRKLVVRKNHKPVGQYDLNDILIRSFISIKEAAETLQYNAKSIYKSCQDGIKPLGGFRWKYLPV